MKRSTRLLLATALVVTPTLVGLAQISLSPPPESSPATEPAPSPAPPAPAATMTATAPATLPANTMPSAHSVLENLLKEKPDDAMIPPPSTNPSNPALTPGTEAVAPNEPKVNRLPEGRFLWDRVGRLTKDEKTGTYLFVFDSDGNKMQDPPMALLPSHNLMAMEEASDKGSRAVKFKITGEVTEYRGKNYLYVRRLLIVKDLNQGIGG